MKYPAVSWRGLRLVLCSKDTGFCLRFQFFSKHLFAVHDLGQDKRPVQADNVVVTENGAEKGYFMAEKRYTKQKVLRIIMQKKSSKNQEKIRFQQIILKGLGWRKTNIFIRKQEE